MTERWVNGPEEKRREEYARHLADLKWGPTGNFDTVDLKEFDRLRSEAARAYKASPTDESLFKVCCVLAFSWDAKTAADLELGNKLASYAVHVQSHQFTRAAYMVWARTKSLPARIDVGTRLVESDASDGIALEAYIQDADKLTGLQEAHKKSLEYAQRLLAQYPKRDEKYLITVAFAAYNLWNRSKDPQVLKTCRESAKKALNHPQVADEQKSEMARLLKVLEKY